METNNRSGSKTTEQLVGREIRSPKVLCIDADNNNLGVIPTYEALRLADDVGLDLVQVAPGGGRNSGTFPTCRIINYGKLKYEQSKNQKMAAKKQRESEIKIKEIKFHPSTDLNDLKIKAKHADEFLNEGCRLKISLVFRGREVSHQDLGRETFNTFLDLLSNIELMSNPSFEGREISVMICRKLDKTG